MLETLLEIGVADALVKVFFNASFCCAEVAESAVGALDIVLILS